MATFQKLPIFYLHGQALQWHYPADGLPVSGFTGICAIRS